MKGDVEELLSIVNSELYDYYHGVEHHPVFGHIVHRNPMAKSLPKGAELFEPSINSFVSGTGVVLLLLLLLTHVVNRNTNLCRLSSVASVCLHHFAWAQFVDQLLTKDSNVGVMAACKRPIRVNDVSTID